MRKEFQNMQIDNYIDNYVEDEDLYASQKRLARHKRRKRNRIFSIVGLSGCLALLAVMIYFGVTVIEKAQVEGVEDAVADMEVKEATEAVTYTQQELDEKLAEAELTYARQAEEIADNRAEEVLEGIKQSLQSGVSTVETLRQFYPNDLVLASGGEFHFVPIQDSLQKNDYEEACLQILENGEIQYVENGEVVSYKGIDVSKHQGTIDWKKVAEDGVEFAFIRVALRGYGTGKLVEDEYFDRNIKGAINAGIKVGVYVYSQAITEEEALEEANFVLDKIAPYKLDCPVVYDVELVAGADGRMNRLTPEERTQMALIFCQTIENAGYKPMIYHNMEMAALKINLEALEGYDKWFAYYNQNMYYPYQYDVWQYSEKGRVNGIKGDVDLNISFVPLWEE